MAEQKISNIETIKTEEDSYCDDALYNITSFGMDMSLRELTMMYKEGDLEKPELQRKYVWTRQEASRFIDSILLGLPVPSIFLAKTEDNKRLIVDGYQRIMTVYDFMEGVFSGDGKSFSLTNSPVIHPSWRGKTYAELSMEQQRSIKMFSIHAIVFEQKYPKGDTGMYQIFERINTSGRALKPQEIRNCVYHGSFNKLLFELNGMDIWRNIIGSKQEDSRMADIELILRFFAFKEFLGSESEKLNQINLVKYLNDYMGAHTEITNEQMLQYREEFTQTLSFLYSHIGENLFRTAKIKDGKLNWSKKVNPVVFDAVCVATSLVADNNLIGTGLINKYEQLILDPAFQTVTKQRTTNTDNIKKRFSISAKILYGIEL